MIFATQIAFAALPFCLVLIAWSFWRRSVARKATPLQSASQRWLGGTGMTRNAGRRGRVPRGVFLLVGTAGYPCRSSMIRVASWGTGT